jgi:hypothetical protein
MRRNKRLIAGTVDMIEPLDDFIHASRPTIIFGAKAFVTNSAMHSVHPSVLPSVLVGDDCARA